LNTPNQNKNITIKSLGIYIQPKPLHCSPYPALEKEERKIKKKKKKKKITNKEYQSYLEPDLKNEDGLETLNIIIVKA